MKMYRAWLLLGHNNLELVREKRPLVTLLGKELFRLLPRPGKRAADLRARPIFWAFFGTTGGMLVEVEVEGERLI